jgi:hypothetical protein
MLQVLVMFCGNVRFVGKRGLLTFVMLSGAAAAAVET